MPRASASTRFDKDAQGKSTCYAGVRRKWLPALASAEQAKAGVGSAADVGISLILRDDGGYQWSYRGQTLYRWIRMSSPARAWGWREECLAPRPTMRSE